MQFFPPSLKLVKEHFVCIQGGRDKHLHFYGLIPIILVAIFYHTETKIANPMSHKTKWLWEKIVYF